MVDIDMLLAMGAQFKDVPKGGLVFQEGGSCRFYHQLVTGYVRWVNVTDEGRECLQHIVLPGESFGELPLFDNRPYAAAAVACEDSVILRLKKETFMQLLREDHELHLRLNRKMVERMRFKFMLLRTMSNPDPEVRIRALLNFLKTEHMHICPECHQIKLTRQQMADLCGLRVETVIRVIRRMHDEGQLLVENRKVYFG